MNAHVDFMFANRGELSHTAATSSPYLDDDEISHPGSGRAQPLRSQYVIVPQCSKPQRATIGADVVDRA